MTTHIVSFSGGRTSAFLVHLLEEKRKAEGIKTRYIYLDTSAEHPATYQFIRDIVKNWGIELTCLRVVINPELGQANTYREVSLDEIGPDLQVWRDICGKYGTPYLHGPFCTRVMKKEVYDRYVKDQYTDGDFITYLGIRADEPRRLKPRKGVAYLADIDDSEKPDILRWWKQQPFDLKIREHLGNCVFCVKKRPNKIALAARDEPELAQQFIDVITSPDVRPVPHRKQQDNKIMYRDNQSLEQIIAISSQFTREELYERIRWSGGEDAGSCSESCEVFNDSSDDAVMESEQPKERVRNIIHDYDLDDPEVISVGGGVMILEHKGHHFMGTHTDSDYWNGTPWEWTTITTEIYNQLLKKAK